MYILFNFGAMGQTAYFQRNEDPTQVIRAIFHVCVLSNYFCFWQVQDVLSDAKFLPALSDMFEALGWSADKWVIFVVHTFGNFLRGRTSVQPQTLYLVPFVRYATYWLIHQVLRFTKKILQLSWEECHY